MTPIIKLIYNNDMKVEAENYGQILFLYAHGQVSPQEIPQLIQELVEKCSALSHVVLSFADAEIASAAANPLAQLREKQRWQKPKIWIVSSTLPQADAKTVMECLPLMDSAEALQIGKITLARSEREKAAKRKDEVEERIRTVLGLAAGYQPEDFDAALAHAREHNRVAKLQAAATLKHAEQLRKGHKSPSDAADLVKRLGEIKDKAYAATRGED